MASLTAFITRRLKLKVNRGKSAVVPARALSFLGFGCTGGSRPKRRLEASTVLRFRKRVRVLTRRVRGVSLRQMVRETGVPVGLAGVLRLLPDADDSPTP